MTHETEAKHLSHEAKPKHEGGHEQIAHHDKKPPMGPILRIMYIFNGFGLVMSVMFFMLTSRDTVQYNPSDLQLFATFVLDAVCFWFMAKRLRMARTLLIFSVAVDIVASLMNFVYGMIQTGGEIDFAYLSVLAIEIPLIIYLFRSTTVRTCLWRELDDKEVADPHMPRMNELAFWRNLLMYYCIFSIVGHWMEAGFCTLIRFGLVPGSYDPNNTSLWRDWFYPFPPEGAGFCMCVLVLYPIKNWLQSHTPARWLNLPLSFVSATVMCAAVELIFGLTCNAQLQLWDYSDMFCNFMGQICLQNSLAFGVVATIMTWVVYPACERWIDSRSPKFMTILSTTMFAIYIVLQTLYLVNLPSITADVEDARQEAELTPDGPVSMSVKATTAMTSGLPVQLSVTTLEPETATTSESAQATPTAAATTGSPA